MLKTILTVSGHPGLFKYLSRGKNMLIVERIDETRKRQPIYASDKVSALADISIYTNDDKEVPLASVFQNIKSQYSGKAVELSPKKADQADIISFFEKALPDYDRDRVRVSDMRKVLSWYNVLIGAGLDDFEEKKEDGEAAGTAVGDASATEAPAQ